MIVHSPQTDVEQLRGVAQRMVADVQTELESATDFDWSFFVEGQKRLPDAEDRRPSDFLDEAVRQLAKGPYDLVFVLTDVPLLARSDRIVPGLASPVTRIGILSTRTLRTTPRGEPSRSYDAASLRWNLATLFLHLLGHILGLKHGSGGTVMEPYRFDPDRTSLPTFDPGVRETLARNAARMVGEPSTEKGPIRQLLFHVQSTATYSSQVFDTLVRSRAILLPLSLPQLSTAAITPTLILMFSAESWDVGVHLPDFEAALFASLSIVAATFYLTFVQRLFFPRRESESVTEHEAVMNTTVFLSVLSMMTGLFLLVCLVMLAIEFLIFPNDLITNWPTLEDPQVDTVDLIRTAVFISTLGVLTGSLAGGLESRAFIRHLALFLDRP
ncbi:hypothetical protein [Haloarchaeobius sp. HRN-SO-5]|uniref:hypothetical protein n=1 Tax=Haloarchaeobius sp. HRN-SO-5 TaxID=3446118 RepID=UPI003EC035C2